MAKWHHVTNSNSVGPGGALAFDFFFSFFKGEVSLCILYFEAQSSLETQDSWSPHLLLLQAHTTTIHRIFFSLTYSSSLKICSVAQ